MLTVFFIIGLAGTIILVFHVSLEINTIEKRITELADFIRKHYER